MNWEPAQRGTQRVQRASAGRRPLLSVSALVAVTLSAVSIGRAQPLYFPGTGHYYELIHSPVLDWRQADILARYIIPGPGGYGYLATVTSQAENDFIAFDVIPPPLQQDGFWLGGHQVPGSPEPDGGWHWVTGEPWTYDNWYPGQPDNRHSSGPDAVAITRAFGGTWDDRNESTGYASGFIIEYEELPKPRPTLLHALCVGVDYGYTLNGGADARAIYRQLSRFAAWAPTNPPPLVLDPSASGDTNLREIERALAGIRSNLGPDDEFVFYFSGHGGFPTTSGGDETPVWVSVGPFDLWNEHDEYAVLQNGSFANDLSDDTLKEWFDDPLWNQVDKLFLLDACHSGGFWGDNNPNDLGDLEKLPRTGLLASCPEWGVSFSNPLNGRGIWTYAVESVLATAATVDQLSTGIADWDWSEWVGRDLPLRKDDLFPPEGATATFRWDPVFYYSDDFEMTAFSSRIPEPCTLSLLILGSAGLIRRRRSG